MKELFDQSFLSSRVKLKRAPPVLILQVRISSFAPLKVQVDSSFVWVYTPAPLDNAFTPMIEWHGILIFTKWRVFWNIPESIMEKIWNNYAPFVVFFSLFVFRFNCIFRRETLLRENFYSPKFLISNRSSFYFEKIS